MKKKNFPFYKQLDQMDCGPTCLRMISRYFGRSVSLQYLRERSFLNRQGVSLLGISEAAESIGLRTLAVKVPFEKLASERAYPFIVHWNQKHFVIVWRVRGDKVYVADPAQGLLTYSKSAFFKSWLGSETQSEGIALLVQPAPSFYEEKDENHKTPSIWSFVWGYMREQRVFMVQLVLSLLFVSLFFLLTPFLTQAVVDIGIQTRDISLVVLILSGQAFLLVSRIAVEFIRRWVLLHLSTRLNISLISDFLMKLMRLQMGFFDSKRTGDLLQRIGDHSRIQAFLSSSTLSVLFSFFNLIIFGVVLALYHLGIWLVFMLGSAIYIAWILLFLRYRKQLDYKRFQQLANNQNSLIQIISGMQEIKLHHCEHTRRWEWERIQIKLFKVNIESLRLEQIQEAGSLFTNESKNLLITFLAAWAVIQGEMTLGMMLAIQYILGQLNAPISQMIQFVHQYQDARISLERLQEVYLKPDEDEEQPLLPASLLHTMPIHADLTLRRLSFQYEGQHSPKVLDQLDLPIPKGKVTAIVGTSGSGKTTLLKLLLKYYPPTEGQIKVGQLDLAMISSDYWRMQCGVVMQEGYIFSDSIARNIALDGEQLDYVRLEEAAQIANITELIQNLPLGWQTKIGAEGVGLSTGQKQRILIARAVYKNPQYLFFDEATSALDAENERIIIENLQRFFKGKTVVIIAHRLSTVKQADKIVVLEKGKIVESGTHTQLTTLKGKYYHLVKNQLELGN
ncbi:MAG: peptidase domain-containing ABC transporter [Saprospiraceae bacterium]|nr:peptidase domain-containing ABC transporter [Saprospiraceae bacterium]